MVNIFLGQENVDDHRPSAGPLPRTSPIELIVSDDEEMATALATAASPNRRRLSSDWLKPRRVSRRQSGSPCSEQKDVAVDGSPRTPPPKPTNLEGGLTGEKEPSAKSLTASRKKKAADRSSARKDGASVARKAGLDYDKHFQPSHNYMLPPQHWIKFLEALTADSPMEQLECVTCRSMWQKMGQDACKESH